jgi:cysteine-rich repeat protein
MSLFRSSRVGAFAATLLAVCALASTATADVLAPFQETPVITGLTNPTAVRFAPDGRIFVSEQSGLLKVYNGLGDTTPDIAADLRNEVMNNWDRGFLGLAIDPQFPAPGHDYVYVLYTVDAPPGQNPPVWNDACADQLTNGCVTRGRLSRLEIGPNNAQIGPEQILVDNRWCFQFVTHSVGDLHFGPEGALYVSAGEGANYNFTDYGQAGNPCNDPLNEGGALRSQDILTPADPQSWDGTLLRLDVSGPTPVPWPTNPRVGVGSTDDDAIIAHGLRNPYRFTIHPPTGPQAGEIWVGDVGEAGWEEINRIPSPTGPFLNFGWPCYEGGSGVSLPHGSFVNAGLPLCDGLYNGTIASNVTPSYWGYNHNDKVVPGEVCGTNGGSITGVAFYGTGTYPPEYQNALFFEDYTRRCIWAMLPDTPGGIPNPNNRRSIVWNSVSGSVDIEVGPGGDLYYAEYSSGQITRLQYFSTNHPPVAALQATPSSGSTPLAVAFDASGSTDADPGETLAYAWDLDGDGQFDDAPDADPRFAHATYTHAGPVIVSVRVTDSHGASSSASQTVTVANSPPTATILTPPGNLLWRVGDEIFFSGRGDDPDEGQLPAANLTWQTIIHHCTAAFECHTHNVQSYPGVDHGSFLAPDHGYPSYLEIQLTARDSGVGSWLDTSWTTRRSILFNNSTQLTNLVGFPVLIKLDASNIDYSKTQNAGQDLRFTDPDGSLLPHQIESWDETGTSYVWVRVPQIDAGSSSDFIYMYYGNPTAPDGQNPSAVWDSTYAAVYHMGSTPSDSTAHANDGSNHGTTLVPGQIGSARLFNGATWIDVASSPSLAIDSTLTLETWVKIANPALNEPSRILDKKFNFTDAEGYDLEYQSQQNYVTVLGSGGDWGRADVVDLDTQWHWLSATISGITARVYVDGVDRTTDSQVSPVIGGPLPLNIGRNPNGGYFQGAIDELRISNVARSPDWMRAQYLSMSGAFTTIGPEQGSGVLTATTSVNIYPETKNLSFATNPTGLQLTVGSDTKTTPFTETVITNSTNSLSVQSPQQLGGVDQLFASWSDGGAQSHEIVATPSFPGVTATFVSALCGNGVLDAGEECDDHNTANGDCCSALCHFEATGSTCNDGNACTTGDSCSAGTCSGGTAVVCNDSNACTADTCSPATGCVYDPAPLNGTSCSDGNACTLADTCNAGTCAGGGTVVCNDSNGCTLDTCNPASGCVFNPAPLDGTTCNDSQICTIGDVCSAGVCAGSPAPDGDVDGRCNANDNCPYVANPGQQDSGGITLLIPDGIGDACQCGDLTGEGVVDEGDVLAYRNHLADPTGLPLVGAAAAKCSVVGGDPAECNLLDVVITRRALLGAGPGIAQVCIAALPH